MAARKDSARGEGGRGDQASEPSGPTPTAELQPLSELVNLKLETDERISRFAKENKLALIAFIAPYVTVRVSPVERARAFIGLPDEFGIEALMKLLQHARASTVYLLVNSTGGLMDSSYKIARAIRSRRGRITTFVPHIAASGGTLLALTGDEIVMGAMSHLTPLDIQLGYKETSVSAATFMRFFTRASKWFEKITSEEAPYPQKALADKLDPFLMEEWSGLLQTAISYVREILELGPYKANCEEIARALVLGFPSHSFVINRDKAREIGLKVKDSEATPPLGVSCATG